MDFIFFVRFRLLRAWVFRFYVNRRDPDNDVIRPYMRACERRYAWVEEDSVCFYHVEYMFTVYGGDLVFVARSVDVSKVDH